MEKDLERQFLATASNKEELDIVHVRTRISGLAGKPQGRADNLFSSVSSPSQSPVSYPSLPDYPPHSPSVLPSPSNNAALKRICGVTDHQSECLAIFGPSLTGAIEPLSVLKMGIQTLHIGYDVCLEVFDLGITDLDQALTAISSNDMDSLVQLLNGVIGYAETCKDAFTEQGEIASPLAEINDRLDKLGSISISISILVPGVTII
ncbi:hypothetical protein NC651_006831 [Populus alba x Populus x berolinensis]|nr:hypothetical protein NC651_006831 [Populus alba x Populus x berolinensis]